MRSKRKIIVCLKNENYLIAKNGYIENEDFIAISQQTNGRPSTDFVVTIDMAKELCNELENQAHPNQPLSQKIL